MQFIKNGFFISFVKLAAGVSLNQLANNAWLARTG
jgi:hypothetical protein